MTTDLDNKIVRQIEYYFGDYNLPRDKFLSEKVKEDDGWITLEVLLTFKRLASLSTDPEVIAAAVEKAENGLMEVSEDKKKIRRNPDLPIPELNDARKKELQSRTAYAKGFPRDEELNDIMTFLEAHGPVESCFRRHTPDKKFKGSCFITFKDVDTCKKFIEDENIEYKGTKLIKKFQADYFVDKKKEYEDRVKAKKDKKEAQFNEKLEKIGLPTGATLHFTGIPEGVSITREDIKEKVSEIDAEAVYYTDFSKGDLQGYLRLKVEDGGKELIKKIPDNKLVVGEATLEFRVLEGDEENTYLKKTAETMTKMREKAKMGKFGRKRKGHFSNGREAKQRRTD